MVVVIIKLPPLHRHRRHRNKHPNDHQPRRRRANAGSPASGSGGFATAAAPPAQGRASEKPLATVLPPNRAQSNAFCLRPRPDASATLFGAIGAASTSRTLAKSLFAAGQSSISRQHRPRSIQGLGVARLAF